MVADEMSGSKAGRRQFPPWPKDYRQRGGWPSEFAAVGGIIFMTTCGSIACRYRDGLTTRYAYLETVKPSPPYWALKALIGHGGAGRFLDGTSNGLSNRDRVPKKTSATNGGSHGPRPIEPGTRSQ